MWIHIFDKCNIYNFEETVHIRPVSLIAAYVFVWTLKERYKMLGVKKLFWESVFFLLSAI